MPVSSMVLHKRRVAPPLDAFVDHLWSCERPALPHAREWGLPGVGADIIVPLAADAVRRFDGSADRTGQRFIGGLLQGAREQPFLRDTSSASRVVGIHLRPGGLAAFTGEPLDRFTDRAVALPDLWGAFAGELRERLLATRDAGARLALLEALLLGRLRRATAADALAAWAIDRLAAPGAQVGPVQRASGLSAQSFIRRFRAATGLAPKRFCELLRFGAAVAHGHSHAASAWSEVAATAGYADQAHLTREFRRFAGLTPGRYRRHATAFAMHVAAP